MGFILVFQNSHSFPQVWSVKHKSYLVNSVVLLNQLVYEHHRIFKLSISRIEPLELAKTVFVSTILYIHYIFTSLDNDDYGVFLKFNDSLMRVSYYLDVAMWATYAFNHKKLGCFSDVIIDKKPVWFELYNLHGFHKHWPLSRYLGIAKVFREVHSVKLCLP